MFGVHMVYKLLVFYLYSYLTSQFSIYFLYCCFVCLLITSLPLHSLYTTNTTQLIRFVVHLFLSLFLLISS